MNKKMIGAFAVLFLLLGCNSVLYKDSRSPIYGSLKDKQQNKVSSTFSSGVGGRVPLQIQNSRRSSLENASARTIEVRSSNDNPYVDTYSKPETSTRAVRPDSVSVKRPNRLSKPLAVDDSVRRDLAKEVDNRSSNNRNQQVDRAKQRTLVNNQSKAKDLSASKPLKEKSVKEVSESVDKQITKKTDEKLAESQPIKETQRPKKKPKRKKTAIQSLLKEAHESVRAGNLDKASAALERAHRIEPSNAKILYDISQIKYAQGKYREADSFASRATNFSKSRSLSKKIWKLLLSARKALGNESGAAMAKQKIDSF